MVGGGLVGTAALGDAPGSVAGGVMMFNAVLGGVSAGVSGITGLLGQATGTDVKDAQDALAATSNLPGLAVTSATGNLKAGEVAATLGNVASLAAAPRDAVSNPATAADTIETVKDTGGLIQGWVNSIKSRWKAV